jgi:hypothetical protein
MAKNRFKPYKPKVIQKEWKPEYYDYTAGITPNISFLNEKDQPKDLTLTPEEVAKRLKEQETLFPEAIAQGNEFFKKLKEDVDSKEEKGDI